MTPKNHVIAASVTEQLILHRQPSWHRNEVKEQHLTAAMTNNTWHLLTLFIDVWLQ